MWCYSLFHLFMNKVVGAVWCVKILKWWAQVHSWGGQAKAAVNLKQILNAKSTMFVPSDNMVTFCIQLQLIENFQVFRDHFEIQALL